MAESQYLEHSIKYQRGVNHSIYVKLGKIFHLRNSALIELEVVNLESQSDVLQNIIDNHYGEFLVITV